MRNAVARHVAAGAAVLAVAACGATQPDAAPSTAIDASIAILAADGPRWARELCDGELVEGTLHASPAAFATLAGESTGIDMAGNRTWSLVVELAGTARRVHLYVHEQDRDEAALHLREANGQRVWFLGAEPLHAAHDLHVAAATARELASVQQLLAVPLRELVDGVAHADPSVDALFADVRARRLTAQQVLAQLEPWDQRLLPALLHVMSAALTTPQPDDQLAPAQLVRLSGYVSSLDSTFDIACLASQALRGFLAPPSDDAGRQANLRALAVWLRLLRLGPMRVAAFQR